MPWWAEPNKPEEPKEPSVEVTESVLTEEDKRHAWRLLMLLDAFRDLRPHESVSLDEIDLLGRVARGNHDLHDACAALRNGCKLEYLVVIFT